MPRPIAEHRKFMLKGKMVGFSHQLETSKENLDRTKAKVLGYWWTEISKDPERKGEKPHVRVSKEKDKNNYHVYVRIE